MPLGREGEFARYSAGAYIGLRVCGMLAIYSIAGF